MATKRQPDLGVHLLETITRGMYSEPFHCIREYIQNAYDSIRKARRDGLISSNEGQILLTVDEAARRLSIRDNGTGLSPEAAAVHLLDIGKSSKGRSDEATSENAGFRGIGRLAGISYCKTLRFTTSCGDGKKCVVEFDAAGINRLTERGQEPATIVEAIDRNSRISDDVADDDAKYLEVTLEGIDPDIPFLDNQRLCRYLELNAPVPNDPQVWSHTEKIRQLAETAGCLSSLEEVQIFICDADGKVQEDVRRPFKDTFQTANALGKRRRTVRVSDVRALPLNNSQGNGWWGWIAVHEREGALADVPFAGLRIRMHNIAIGDDSILQSLFPTQPHARWCFGDIHVTDPALTPNSQRDDFEPSKAWNRLKEGLREEAILLDREIRRESDERNRSVSTLKKRTEEQIDNAKDTIARGFASHDQKLADIQKLEVTKDKLDRHIRTRGRSEDEKEALNNLRLEVERVLTEIRAVRKTGTDDALAHLNRQARSAVRTVFKVLKGELNERQFNAIQEKIHAALKPGKRKT